jgi:hypothetical protein
MPTELCRAGHRVGRGAQLWLVQPIFSAPSRHLLSSLSLSVGGSIDGCNYYVSGDFLSTNLGIDEVTPTMTQIHDQSSRLHTFAYFDKVIDGENRVPAIAGPFNGRFEMPNNPSTPTFSGMTFLNGIPAIRPEPGAARLNE